MRDQGYSYIEILVAVVLIALALPPALESLGAQVRSATQGISEMNREYRLASRMEEVAARPFPELDLAAELAGSQATPSEFSDTAGTEDRLLVFLSHYDFDDTDADGDPFTNPGDHLIWIRVEIEGSSLMLEQVLTWD